MTQRSRTLQFGLLLAVGLGLWWRPLADTLRVALISDAHSHILLIVPLSCALVFLRRKTRLPDPNPSVGTGSALLIVALLIAGFSKYGADGLPQDVRLSLSILALVAWWIGSVLLCFGARVFQAFLFPLCLLFWIVPIPELALDAIIPFLQHQSAFAARVMFLLIGVPVTQDGIMLSIPSLDIEVARECSSIRSSMILVITTMVLSHLFLRSSWRKALLIAAAVPVAVAKNGLRIFAIAQLGTRVDSAFLDGNLHHRGGIVFFAISVMAVIGCLWALRRTDRPETASASVNDRQTH
ncbi:MAG: exosortase/archaeosortase family protein [Terriglobales bacterium]